MFYLMMHPIHFIYGYMVKYHSDSKRKPAAGTDRIAHTTAFATPVMKHWLEREIAPWVHPMKDPSNDPSHNERMVKPPNKAKIPNQPFKSH